MYSHSADALKKLAAGSYHQYDHLYIKFHLNLMRSPQKTKLNNVCENRIQKNQLTDSS